MFSFYFTFIMAIFIMQIDKKRLCKHENTVSIDYARHSVFLYYSFSFCLYLYYDTYSHIYLYEDKIIYSHSLTFKEPTGRIA